jgi:hypothetical protein
MSLVHSLGPVGGTVNNPRLTVYVWDDAFADISEEDAVIHATNVAPSTIFDKPFEGDAGVQELAGHIYAIEIGYAEEGTGSSVQAPPAREINTLARRMNFQAQSKFIRNCIQPIGVFDADGDSTANYPHTKWLVGLYGSGADQRAEGLTIDPLPETRTLDFCIPNADVSDSYLDTLEDLCGKFCSGTFFGRPQGSVQLVRVSLQERNPFDWELSLGFGYKAPQFNVDVSDDIVIPEVRASWHYWTREKDVVYAAGGTIGTIIEREVEFAVVQQVWEEGDFDALALPSVTYPEE